MIDSWKVRALEQALEKGFDLDRRMHGWAREGMDMDREDFIDLADVSRQIPGKTPTQVTVWLASLTVRCLHWDIGKFFLSLALRPTSSGSFPW